MLTFWRPLCTAVGVRVWCGPQPLVEGLSAILTCCWDLNLSGWKSVLIVMVMNRDFRSLCVWGHWRSKIDCLPSQSWQLSQALLIEIARGRVLGSHLSECAQLLEKCKTPTVSLETWVAVLALVVSSVFSTAEILQKTRGMEWMVLEVVESLKLYPIHVIYNFELRVGEKNPWCLEALSFLSGILFNFFKHLFL